MKHVSKSYAVLISLFTLSLFATLYLYTISYTNHEEIPPPLLQTNTSLEGEPAPNAEQKSIQHTIQKNTSSPNASPPKEQYDASPIKTSLDPPSPPPPTSTDQLPTSSTQAEQTEQTQLPVTFRIPMLGIDTDVQMPDGSTVYDLMTHLKKTDVLDFTGTNYGTLGYFIESIGGISSDPKARLYWIYAINGHKATTGISTYPLHSHDIISWNYEPEE